MLRVGQIGVGYWGPNLLRNLVANDRANVVAVADAEGDRRRYVESRFPAIATLESADHLINDDDIDAVVIATPAGTHFDLAGAALDAGKHVLVEKPLATTVAEVEDLSAKAEASGLVAMVGHTFLFNPAVEYLRDLVVGGGIGDVRYIHSVRANLGRVRSDVDALWNLAPHDVSIVQHLLDDPTPVNVTRQGMDYVQKGIDDVVFLHVEYPEKVMAHIHVSWLDPIKVRRVTLVGSEKMAVYDDMAEHPITIYDKGVDVMATLGEAMDYDKGPIPEFSYRSGDVLQPALRKTEPLAAEIDHWLDCILDGAECRTGPRHALEVVRILAEAETGNRLDG